MRASFMAAIAGICAILTAATPAPAAVGVAWDSVSRTETGTEAAQPGDFPADFNAATEHAQLPAVPDGDAAAAIRNMMQRMRIGVAQRHYVAGTFIRTDDVAQQTATIVDCAARTLTKLDLAKKTYSVTPLEGAQPAGKDAPAGPFPWPKNAKVDISMASQQTGSKDLWGTSTTGYRLTVNATMTQPSGQTKKLDITMTSYFAAASAPLAACPMNLATIAMVGGGAMSATPDFFTQMLSASRRPMANVHFSAGTTESTLPPTGQFALFTSMQIQLEGVPRAVIMSVENGNIHSISDTDKIFAIPADFTKAI